MSWTTIGGEILHPAGGRLPENLQAAFRARARTVHARADQIVLAEGLEADEVFLIVSGRVKISLFSRQGREAILREMGPGEIFGELAAIDRQPRSANVIALEDTILARLSGAEFGSFLAETPEAGLWMMRELSMRVRDLTAKIFELTTMQVNTRLHCELFRLAVAQGIVDDQAVIDLFPTHSDLASRLGTHREAINRELRQLTKEGIVKQVGRRMHILSVDRLQKLIFRVVP